MKNIKQFIGILFCFATLKTSAQNCPEVEILEESYVEDVSCNDQDSLEFRVYEDCPPNLLIFQVVDAQILTCPNIYIEGNEFGFPDGHDAETEDEFLCPSLFQENGTGTTHSAEFFIVDVNEFPPQPTDGLGISQTLYFNENTEGNIYQFNYTDPDEDEINSLGCTYEFTGDAADTFEIVNDGVDSERNVAKFHLNAKKNLDFEVMSSYSLEAEFYSEDPRGTRSSVTQNFLVFVQDLGDNPPFFTEIVTTASVTEGPQDVNVFQVQAQDRDIQVNNKIMYSINSGNDEGYFKIDEWTGIVSTAMDIDRESLESTNFVLEILAQEVFENDTIVPGDTSTPQNTNVQIDDLNDNIPTFLNDSASVTIDEFDDTSPLTTINLGIVIVVTDMDEGQSGEYLLTTDNANVVLSPTSGNGETNFEISLIKSQDFDYEEQAQNPTIIVKITATEEADSSHVSSLDLTINLVDVNDNFPTFDGTEYSTNVDETVASGTSIIVLTATDDDASSQFNADSVVYSMSGCSEFTIDATTGEVTLASSVQLDYETKTSIDCLVSASDMDGSSEDSLTSQVPLTVAVNDVNDEDPVFINFEDSLNIDEGIETSTTVASVEVEDSDSSADLDVILLPSSTMKSDDDSWFELVKDDSSTPSHYIGNIVVSSPPDHETSSQVSLTIQAIDTAAEIGNQTIQRTMTIIIDDLNDESPEFAEDYSKLSYDEQTPEGVVVLVIEASDPDTDDQLLFSMTDPNEYLTINETSGEVSVVNEVDREEVGNFDVTVTVQDSANHSSVVQISVTVNDINDKTPVLDDGICTALYSVPEDAPNGQNVITVSATDEDEGIHSQISYILQNANQVGSIYQFAPFSMDINTGEISVNTSGDLILDREQMSHWELTVQAYDNCDFADPSCLVNSDSCVMNIEIEDVNDNPPENYDSNEDLVTTEFLLEGEIIPNLEISALDPDEVNTLNSMITFSVESMTYANGSTMELPLFEAVNRNRTGPDQIYEYYCNLEATTNLTGLRGDYVIEILGSDSGSPEMNSTSNFGITIKDANDMSPKYTYADCLLESGQQILMQENVTAVDVPLDCSYQDVVGRPADIYLTDDDQPNTPNSNVSLKIDLDSSVAVDGGANNQLEDFYVYIYSTKGQFGIATSKVIDREKGSAYNLSLVAQDKGDPPQITYSWIYIEVADFSEFFPIFCSNPPCQQTLSIHENSNETSPFTEATDKDNSEDEINDIIYYSILKSDVDAFYIPNNTVNEIRPKVPLDRESLDTYQLEIMSSNSPQGIPPTGVDSTNRVLKISITILDENDETPTYDEVIYGDFLNTFTKGEQVALLEFTDKDLDDKLIYTFGSSFVWDQGQEYTDPFSINEIDDRTSEIVLNMDPEGSYGYCSFSVVATDAAQHWSSAMTEVFVVTTDYIVPFYFFNDIDDVKENQENIETVFTDVFNYTSIIDSIDKAVDSNNAPIEGQTIVRAHFIDEIITQINSSLTNSVGKEMNPNRKRSGNSVVSRRFYRNLIPSKHVEVNEKDLFSHTDQNSETVEEKASDVTYALVPASEIEEEGTNGQVTNELVSQLNFFGLNLVRIGDTDTTLPDDNQTEVNLKIGIGVVTLVLGLLVIMLVIFHVVKTTKLKRQVKVLSTNAEPASDMKNLDEVERVPGSNQYAQAGTNPMFQMSEEKVKDATKDSETESQTSGDSVLVGLEDDEDFKEYDPNNTESPRAEAINFEYQSSTENDETPSISNISIKDDDSIIKEKESWETIVLEDRNPPGQISDTHSLSDSIEAQINSQFTFK